MPMFMDVHKMPGVKKEMLVEAHKKDLAVQAKHGVKYTRYWVDEQQGKVFCLCEAPNAAAAKAVHAEAGHPAHEIYQVHEGH